MPLSYAGSRVPVSITLFAVISGMYPWRIQKIICTHICCLFYYRRHLLSEPDFCDMCIWHTDLHQV